MHTQDDLYALSQAHPKEVDLLGLLRSNLSAMCPSLCMLMPRHDTKPQRPLLLGVARCGQVARVAATQLTLWAIQRLQLGGVMLTSLPRHHTAPQAYRGR